MGYFVSAKRLSRLRYAVNFFYGIIWDFFPNVGQTQKHTSVKLLNAKCEESNLYYEYYDLILAHMTQSLNIFHQAMLSKFISQVHIS